MYNQKEVSKKYYQENLFKIRERQKKYYLKNKEIISKKHKQYRENNIDKINNLVREWQKNNPNKVFAYSKKHVAELKNKGKIDAWYDKIIPRGYLIRGCQQGINRVSLPVSVIALDTLLIGWLTPYIITNVYTNKRIDTFLLDFTAFSEKLTPSKLTPSIKEKTLCDKNNELGEKLLHDSDKILVTKENKGAD